MNNDHRILIDHYILVHVTENGPTVPKFFATRAEVAYDLLVQGWKEEALRLAKLSYTKLENNKMVYLGPETKLVRSTDCSCPDVVGHYVCFRASTPDSD